MSIREDIGTSLSRA